MNPSKLEDELSRDSRIGVIESNLPDEYIYEGSADFLISVHNQRQREEVIEDYEAESDRITVEDPEDTEDWVYRIVLAAE